MSAPVVSVITIFLDAERFIGEAFDSVRAQTFTEWEHILVDDGSRDESSRLARSWAAADPARVRCLEHPGHANRGMSRSRNLGLAAARGEFVALLDGDDVYRPEKLERQVALLRAHPEAAMVYGATEHWYSWTGDPADAGRDEVRRLGVPTETLVPPPGLVARWLTLEAQTPGTCGILVRRAALEAVGGFEDRFTGMFEDQAFLFKLALRAPVFVEGGSWDRYRQHPQSHAARARASGDDYKRGVSATHAAFLDWLEAYLAEHDIEDAGIERALREARSPRRSSRLRRLRLGLRR